MARTTDSARFEGYAVAADGRWDGFLRLTYPSPLDTGAWIKTVGRVMFVSRLSPVTATGATEYIVQYLNGAKAEGRDS